MQYSFDVQEAIDYGVNEAIMIWNLRFWIIKNKANNRHFYDGRNWTYNSHDAFQRLFPFWTKDQVRRILEKLLDKKVIIKGNFNANSYNKTTWYAFAEESKFMSSDLILSHVANLPHGDGENAKSIGQNNHIEMANLENGDGENATSKTDIKPNTKQISLSDCIAHAEKERYSIDVEKFYKFYYVDSDEPPKRPMKQLIRIWADKPANQIKKLVAKNSLVTPEECPELIAKKSEIKFRIAREFGNNELPKLSPIRLEKNGDSWTLLGNDERVWKYQEVLEGINVKIVCQK